MEDENDQMGQFPLGERNGEEGGGGGHIPHRKRKRETGGGGATVGAGESGEEGGGGRESSGGVRFLGRNEPEKIGVFERLSRDTSLLPQQDFSRSMTIYTSKKPTWSFWLSPMRCYLA